MPREWLFRLCERKRKVSEKLQICEVSPRDGLQSAGKVLSVEERVSFCSSLIHAGLKKIEVGSLVNPQKVPAMAQSDEVFLKLKEKHPQAELWLLVPNEKGLIRAIEIGSENIAFFTATSETFNLKNINQTLKNSVENLVRMVDLARKAKIKNLRLYISTVFHCAYEGKKNPTRDLKIFEDIFSLFEEISLGDTTGKGTEEQMQELLEFLSIKEYRKKIWWHFHDTYGSALSLIKLALKENYRFFDASAGGIGGCPFAPGARGNVDTLALIKLAQEMQIPNDYSFDKIKSAIPATLVG